MHTGGNYIWNILNDKTAAVNQTTGKVFFDNLMVYEGSLVTFSYVVNTFAKQTYKIPSEDADISTLTVKVRPNESSTQFDIYNRVETVSTISPTSRSYFLAEGEDMRYEIRFGDDSVGRKLRDGEVVDLEYLVTSGPEANNNARFAFTGRMIDNFDQAYTPTTVNVTVKDKSQQGAACRER